MRVTFIPDYSKGNPYQKELADSLSKEDVEVSKHWKPDILHLHWHHPFLLAGTVLKTIIKSVSFIGELVTLKLFGIKIVWTVHNITNHEEKFSFVELFFSKLLARLCNKIIVHSQYAKYEVKKAYGMNKESKFAIISHGNYIDSYENIVSKSKTRNQLEINDNDMVFLYFGLIRPYKGVSELIEAFKRLNTSQTKLLVVGKPHNDEIVNNIRELCNKNKNIKTIFAFVPDDEIQVYMNAADIVVLPYRDILTSGAVILAMSFGKPVIAPAIGCIPDVLDSEGGFLYDPSEKESLLKAMKQALNVDLVKMGEHNFELAKQLSWDNIAKRTYEVYRICLKGRK